MNTPFLLLSAPEQALRLTRLRAMMTEAGLTGLLASDFADLFCLTGRVYAGYAYIGAEEGSELYFVRRPVGLKGPGVHYVRKPEEMAEKLPAGGVVGLELAVLSAMEAERLAKALPGRAIKDGTAALRRARAVKTAEEQRLMRRSGVLHEAAYRQIPKIYRPGMTDIELEIEIERRLRLEGCLGQFRIAGSTMESYMGSVISGANGDVPSPYDFTMGGAGLSPSFPSGADGGVILPGTTTMVDLCGNFTGYMTDMSRTYSLGDVGAEASKAHQCSIDICARLARDGKPGARCADLYETALSMAREAGLGEYFMGHRQQAGFIGHGVGIQVNETPVLSPRSRDVLEEGNTIALEPKFVLPKVGPVGIENTYIVTSEGLERITNAPEELTPLD